MDINKIVDAAKELDKKVNVQEIVKNVAADGKLDKDDVTRAAQEISKKITADEAMDIAKKAIN